MKKITASLLVCTAAALFAAIALLLNPNPTSAPASPTSSGPSQATASDGGPAGGDGYGKGKSDGGPARSTSPDGATAPNRSASTATLSISNFAFSSVQVAPGATVSVANNDSATHTVTAKNGEFDAGSVRAGAKGSFVAPNRPGTYAFFCEIHPSMTGELVVR